MKLSELSKDAKSAAIDEARYWWADGDWWDSTYEMIERDLAILGFDEFRITGFDLDRGRRLEYEFSFVYSPEADLSELPCKRNDAGEYEPHPDLIDIYRTLCSAGAMCAMYDMTWRLKSWGSNKQRYGRDIEFNEYDFMYYLDEALGTTISEMLDSAMQDVEHYALKMLDDELEWLTSDEFIAENLEENYEFDEDGGVI